MSAVEMQPPKEGTVFVGSIPETKANGYACEPKHAVQAYHSGNGTETSPLRYSWSNAAGDAGGTARVVGFLVVIFCVIAASLASVSRITWAWARDGGLSIWFVKIHPKHRVHIRSLWLPVIIVSCLALFTVDNTATSTVFSAFTPLSSLGLYSSYIIALGCMLHARLTGRIGDGPQYPVQYGGWKLPKGFGIPLNIIALIWTIYLTVWLPFQITIPVTGTNMKYAGPIYVFLFIAAVMWWFAHRKQKWPGLNTHAIAMVEPHE